LVLVDATVWIDYLKGISTPPQVEWLEESLGVHPLGLTDITFCEVMQGVRNRHEEKRVKERLLSFEVFATGGLDLALSAAENYRLLRGLGITIRKTIDCWIATFCLREGHSLLHSDRDFLPFEEHLGLHAVGRD
jgi:predicted nucleic acid-binding protein